MSTGSTRLLPFFFAQNAFHSVAFASPSAHTYARAFDPTYSRNDLLVSDARWVSMLGRDLAAWLHVPHRDLAFG